MVSISSANFGDHHCRHSSSLCSLWRVTAVTSSALSKKQGRQPSYVHRWSSDACSSRSAAFSGGGCSAAVRSVIHGVHPPPRCAGCRTCSRRHASGSGRWRVRRPVPTSPAWASHRRRQSFRGESRTATCAVPSSRTPPGAVRGARPRAAQSCGHPPAWSHLRRGTWPHPRSARCPARWSAGTCTRRRTRTRTRPRTPCRAPEVRCS